MRYHPLNSVIIEPIIRRTCEKLRSLHVLPPERLLLLPRHVQYSYNSTGQRQRNHNTGAHTPKFMLNPRRLADIFQIHAPVAAERGERNKDKLDKSDQDKGAVLALGDNSTLPLLDRA